MWYLNDNWPESDIVEPVEVDVEVVVVTVVDTNCGIIEEVVVVDNDDVVEGAAVSSMIDGVLPARLRVNVPFKK